MEPKRLSATAIHSFEACPARFKAEYIDRVPRVDGRAALLGTAVHETLEEWVKDGWHLKKFDEFTKRDAAIQLLWNKYYYTHFSDTEYFQTGWEMLLKWVQNTNFEGREVISTERRSEFTINTSIGPLPVVYVWDRADLLEDSDIEIVDYKTVIRPVQPAQLKQRIQPRLYALSAAIQFKDTDFKNIWVTYDLLRYEPVSVMFTREDNEETYKWLKAIAERIIASDGLDEKLNPECRFCIRKHNCMTLQKHGDGGGVIGIDNLEDAIDRRAKMEYARSALNSALAEMDELILEMAEEAEIREAETEKTRFRVTATGRREADSERIARIIGPELLTRYGKVGVTDVDRILKEEGLTSDQRSQIKQSVTKKFGKAIVKTEPKIDFEED